MSLVVFDIGRPASSAADALLKSRFSSCSSAPPPVRILYRDREKTGAAYWTKLVTTGRKGPYCPKAHPRIAT